MFEKFSRRTVRAVHTAVRTAQQDDSPTIEEEHLLFGILSEAGPVSRRVLGSRITPEALREAFARARRRGDLSETDMAALRRMGIDVRSATAALEWRDEPRRARPRRRFGGGHRPFSPDSKRALSGAVAEAREMGARRIEDVHVLLAVLRGGGLASGVLTDLGLDYQAVRRALGGG
ncbi:ClpA/ClpB-like protein [Stackebrandtia albiflava]|uniref:ClpA/ClpB-like protein n=1 Tax=Stackebrandtia albiflava TaxID=406432 RepID=A0A562VEI4_9ACTN|nr:Clp protease N-terminal domain-containing protein [Stackebrandtia albiflava]TWJ16268.1 ClpA/ClpB-like protein [Stackebrandtia albiflava]